MKISYKRRFKILLCVLVFYKSYCEGRSQEQDISIRDKTYSETDLLRNYETLWRNAVARDTIVANVRSQKDKYVSINNGQDFNIPINDNIMSRPIGTYQYIDADGDLHIVNFINDPNGLRILNDYKPFTSIESKSNLKNMRSNHLKNKNSEKENKRNEFSNERHSNGNESDRDINYEEYEFTFIPQEINNSEVKHKNKTNDLKSDESNKNINNKLKPNEESDKFTANNYNNYNKIHEMIRLMSSMPLSQPFTSSDQSLPNIGSGSSRRPPILHSSSHGLPNREFITNLGIQPLHLN